MLGYYLGLAVLFIGTAVSALAYRAKPSGPRLAGMIGFAVAALARLAYILLVLNLGHYLRFAPCTQFLQLQVPSAWPAWCMRTGNWQPPARSVSIPPADA